ncbi:MAG: FHA domain-containing protein [Anaerolineae bacterium]|nr:FHA domain-containing protein [Anaerolineae bacterium]
METPCPVCGHVNHENGTSCANCHVDLYDSLMEIVATRSLSILHTNPLKTVQTQLLENAQPIIIYFDHDDVPMVVDRDQSFVIGRQDDRAKVDVDIDLSTLGALEKGVSRSHLILDTAIQPPHVTDLDSYNYSYINGQQLQPQRSYPLASGDELRLGHLTMRVYYK